jgi:hypothetical protein
LAIVATSAALAAAQATTPLTLPQAVGMALEKSPLHKVALAETRIGAAAVRQAQSPLMPRITFSESALRGNDPVFVFGSRLRQQSFTAADFALNRLNTPIPISKFSSRFSGQWNLFDGLQSSYGVTLAKYLKQAAEEQLDRADQELVFQAVQACYGALLAQRQVQVAAAGLETAQAIEASSRVPINTIEARPPFVSSHELTKHDDQYGQAQHDRPATHRPMPNSLRNVMVMPVNIFRPSLQVHLLCLAPVRKELRYDRYWGGQHETVVP